MKLRMRILSGLLALTLLCPAPAAKAAETEEVLGTLSATVRMDYPQNLEELAERNVRAALLKDGESLGEIPLYRATGEEETEKLGEYSAAVSHLNRDGGALGGGSWPGYLSLSVRDVPRGTYTLRFLGNGYCTYDQEVTLDEYAQHVILGTGDETFSLGDFNGDGRVDTADRAMLSEALGSEKPEPLKKFDVNGDNKINVIDLACVNRQIGAEGGAELLDTALLKVPAEVDGQAFRLVDGSLDDLFRDNGETVRLAPSSGSSVVLPIEMTTSMEFSELRIVSPVGDGAPQSGEAAVEDEDGNVEIFPFDVTPPAGLFAIGEIPGTSVITISLGRRVPVKKITITVTKCEGGGYATIESIQFLKDIVPENPVAPNSRIKGLKAVAGSEKVDLTWNTLPNVSGYQVEYRLLSGGEAKYMMVDVNRAEVTGLENLKTYLFTVTPVDGSWKGQPSDPVTATPQPSSVPDAPDMVSIRELDGALGVSWKAGDEATYYEVFYRVKGSDSYQKAGDRLTTPSTVISGLANGTTYEVYVTAGNDIGVSAPSRISEGTPKATVYERPEGMPTEGVLDRSKIASITLSQPGNYNGGEYTADAPFSPENMIDGDYKTHWTAGNWWNNEHVNVTFTEPVDLYTALWVPRLDGSYAGNLRAYSVLVWYEGEDLTAPGHHLTAGTDNGGGSDGEVHTWPNIPNAGNIPSCKFGILPFGPVTGVVKISIAVEQRGYLAVSLSELSFLEYDPAKCLPDNINALFADPLKTRLADGVTQAQIDGLKARLNSDEKNYYLYTAAMADELALAEELLNSGRSSGVLLEGIQSRDGARDAAYGQGGSYLQPLGAAARANEEITIYAEGIPEGASINISASQFNAEASAWQASMGTLSNGRNVLTVPKIGSQNTPRGGSLYLTYSGANPENIRLHIRRATDIPKLELSNWYELEDSARRDAIGAYVEELETYVSFIGTGSPQTNCLNVTELSLPSVLLSIPALAVWNSIGMSREERVETLYDDVLAWEDIMHICKTTQGIDNTYEKNDMTSRQNIRCMQMFAGAFMYAAGNHIGIGYGSCGGMVCGKPISELDSGASANRLFGWGIAHEIGHNMDKLGKAEITNNIYAIMVQTFDGQANTFASRLEKSEKYPKIFTKTALGHPGSSNDVFVQLGLYWQLHLAYDGADNPLDFYNRFFKAWKAGTYTQGFSGASYDERVALTASGTANRDLTEFFTRWGASLSSEVKDRLHTYPAEDRAVWYLSDQSRRDRLNGAAEGAGSVALTVEKSGDKSVALTMNCALSAGSLQGFEIFRNGTPIAFVPAENGADGTFSYTDVVGTANHRTYTYSVTAYDTLGNEIDTASGAEVRIAYDMAIDPGTYTMERTGETVTITFSEETAVSGWKLANAPASGTYAVTVTGAVKDEDGVEQEISNTALEEDFAANNQAVDSGGYLRYFQKPGSAGTEDTRIWTYDARTIVIEGVPADAADGDIRLISYAGDDAALLEGGFAGLLSEDYVYGDGDGDVIKAGTLVIAGTYRGDPVYNTLKIQGRFTETTDEGETTETERDLDGYTLMFAEIPEDGAVSDISDGIFLFVPDVQREAELQNKDVSSCDGVNLLPSEIRAVLSRTDDPNSPDSQRVTAVTLWMPAPGGEELPALVLEGGKA